MLARSQRLIWCVLALFLTLFTLYAGNYAYRAVAYHGDNVSFTSCPAVLIHGEQDPCVAALQRLLDAEPPYASIHHDGIFGSETLAATREFQSRHYLPVTGKADPATIEILKKLAPDPGSLPVAALLISVAMVGTVLLGRKIIAA
jgi:peptidoglycan hydrolase-like protein with peptidoglycan-binding domain